MTPVGTGLRRGLRARWGLLRIDLHERVAQRLTIPLRRRATASAARTMPPLRKWDGVPERTFVRHVAGENAVRVARLVDLVPPGRRIVDIGVGHGYVAGVLLRDRRPAHYCGIDLREVRTDAVRAMIAANDLGDRSVELVVRDVLDLGEEFWHRQSPDLVLLLEVLEHLPDPAAILRAIAAAVRPGTSVLFTVPLYGRLEHVWGHRSVFDRARLERLCHLAGLQIERARPISGMWSLILARASGEAVESLRGEPDPSYTFAPPRPRRPGRPRRGGETQRAGAACREARHRRRPTRRRATAGDPRPRSVRAPAPRVDRPRPTRWPRRLRAPARQVTKPIRVEPQWRRQSSRMARRGSRARAGQRARAYRPPRRPHPCTGDGRLKRAERVGWSVNGPLGTRARGPRRTWPFAPRKRRSHPARC